MIGILCLAFDESFASPDELMAAVQVVGLVPGVHAELWFPYQAEMLSAADPDTDPSFGADDVGPHAEG